MKVYVLCVLFVACAATARAFDVDPYWKECSVNRTRPGSRTALHSAVQMVCKRRRAMISAGKSHTCVLSPKGFYKCFGDDEFGQSNKHREKWPISKGAKYVQVSAGEMHTCALVDNGSYECNAKDPSKMHDSESIVQDWLGNNDAKKRKPKRKAKWPTSNPGGKKKDGAKYVQVTTGSSHTCALVNDGSYECIGDDRSGRSNGKKPKWPKSNPGGKNKDGA
eukprot:g5901.t1